LKTTITNKKFNKIWNYVESCYDKKTGKCNILGYEPDAGYEIRGKVHIFVIDKAEIEWFKKISTIGTKEKQDGYHTRTPFAKLVGVSIHHTGFENLWNSLEKTCRENPFSPVLLSGKEVKCGFMDFKTQRNRFCVSEEEVLWFKPYIEANKGNVRNTSKASASNPLNDINHISSKLASSNREVEVQNSQQDLLPAIRQEIGFSQEWLQFIQRPE